jgi:heptosyltransferase-3
LRARRYDLVIHLTEHPRGAWLAKLCGARWAVAPKQPGRLWRSAFTHQCPAPKGAPHRHTVERNLDALRRLGIPIHADGKQLTMVPGNQAERHVESLLVQHGLRFQGFVHVHPASRWLFKTWPAEHVAGLIDGLAARNLPVVLTAAPDHAEMALVEAIAGAAHVDVINLGGQLDLKDLAALSASARLFVGVDSAPMHIAAAVGTPVVAIFGPSGELEWRPWGVPHRVVASEFHPCRPCGLDGCGGGKISDCLTSLPAGKVLAACDELL